MHQKDEKHKKCKNSRHLKALKYPRVLKTKTTETVKIQDIDSPKNVRVQ